MDVFAGVHVEAGVEKGAVPQALVRVRLQQFPEVQLVARAVRHHLQARVPGAMHAELVDLRPALRPVSKLEFCKLLRFVFCKFEVFFLSVLV